MITFLQTTSAERVAAKAAHMLEIDPSGWTLTLVCVCVVFSALIILFLAYSVSGGIFTGKINIPNPFRTLKRHRNVNAEEAAAIATALDDYLGDGTDETAAIAIAVHLYFGSEAVHDIESGIITIKR